MRIIARYQTVTSPTRMRTNVRAAVRPVLARAGHRTAARWQRSIPHEWPGQSGRVTLNTARSIIVEQPSATRVTIGTDTVSGKSLEWGAKPHLIRPRNPRGRVAWPASRGGYGPPGERRVRKVAHHPGVHARFYGVNALNREVGPLRGELSRMLAMLP